MENRKTNLRQKINLELKKIPKGKTTTYKALANKFKSHPRAVAKILSTNKDKSVPCYKVIRSDGKIGGYNGLLGLTKKQLLQS
jgi:methylated-DNA-[protein]-cysteine S-methyltransferase